ncbi:MAG: ArnT family glycosyltransferase [Alphaproteobacteria bacterium]
MGRTRWRSTAPRACTAVILLLFAAAFAAGLDAPFERDEGEYAHAAEILASGGVPYRDAFLQKPPGIVFVHAAVLSVFGPSDMAAHAAVLASYLATLVLLACVARRLGGEVAAPVAVLLAALAFLSPVNESYPANTEAFLVLPATAAYLLLVRAWDTAEGARPSTAAASGLALGVAALFKQTAFAHLPHVLAGWALLGRDPRRRAGLVGAFLAGAAAPWVAAVAAWSAWGALGPFLDGVLLHNLRYVGFNPEGRFGEMLARRVAAASFFDRLLWVAGAGGAVLLAALGRRRAAFVAGGWLATAVLAVSAGGYFRGHYLLQAVPPLALSAALALVSLPSAVGATILAALSAAWVAAWPVSFRDDAAARSFARYGGARFANGPAIGRILAHDAARRGLSTLFVLGSEPQLHHYSGLRAVTPWVILSPLTGGYPDSRARQEAAWRDVEASRPDYLVVSVPSAVPTFRHSDLFLWERVVDLVRRDYEPLGKTSGLHRGVMRPGADVPADFEPDLWIFRRKGAGGALEGGPDDARFEPAPIDWPPARPSPDELLPGNPPPAS